MLKNLREEIEELGPEHKVERGRIMAGSAVSVSATTAGACAEFFDLAGDMVMEFCSLGLVGIIGFALFKFFAMEMEEY